MTDRAPIPAEAFDDAVDRLDRDALAAFVGRLEAAAREAAAVEVDPPVVTVGDGDDRERILVAPDSTDAAADRSENGAPPPDEVVVGPDDSKPHDSEVPVRTTGDLRRRLLYSAPPEVANSIAEEWLGVPARSPSYVPEPAPTTAAGGDSDADAPGGSGRDPGVSADPASGATPSSAGGPSGRRDPPAPEGSAGAATPDGQSGGAGAPKSTGITVVVVLVVIISVVTGGVVYAAEIAPDGDAGAFAAPASVGDTLSDAEVRRDSRSLFNENGPIDTATATPMPGDSDGSGGHPLVSDTETDRNVRPAPTCERSFLHVVQIQLNALKYNNNTTDDGIRTVRRFASPRNRQAIRTFDEFASIIKNPTYSPMLSHDSAQYTPIPSSDDYAQVQVITREDGNVTGQYYFRVRKIDGGEYDGCWMTDAVVSVPETTNFSGKVGGRSTIDSNETS